MQKLTPESTAPYSLRGRESANGGSARHLPGVISQGEVVVKGIRTFFREAGRRDAPTLLLPHGYPCSSFQYRNLMPALADRWYVLAPDFPGFGYSSTPAPEIFKYDFDGYTDFLDDFVNHFRLKRFALYLHDYGSQIGLRLAMRDPERIAALIIQNGDIYEDVLGPKYATIKNFWKDPSPANRQTLEKAVCEAGFRDEFIGEISRHIKNRVPPDLWKLHWPLMNTPTRRQIALNLMIGLKANLDWFPRYQAYLRNKQPPTLIVWGVQDAYMPKAAAKAYLRDLPDAELHLFNGGHWLLETHLHKIIPLIRQFLGKIHQERQHVDSQLAMSSHSRSQSKSESQKEGGVSRRSPLS